MPATGLVTQLARAHAEGRLEEKLVLFTKPTLPTVDKMGYLPFETNAAHLFFQLASRCYERGSIRCDGYRLRFEALRWIDQRGNCCVRDSPDEYENLESQFLVSTDAVPDAS